MRIEPIADAEQPLYNATTTDHTPVQTNLPRPRLFRWSALREILDLIVLVGAIYALVNLTTVRFIVKGPSMEPNFQDGQFLIVSRINYMLGEPQHGDIIVFHFPDNPSEDYIKRVIGVPGDKVEFRGGLLYVNDQVQEEPYINEECTRNCGDQTWNLEDDQFFVMGDNRNRSQDSRSFGVVERKYIVGEVVLRYWPPSDWGIVHQIAYPD